MNGPVTLTRARLGEPRRINRSPACESADAVTTLPSRQGYPAQERQGEIGASPPGIGETLQTFLACLVFFDTEYLLQLFNGQIVD